MSNESETSKFLSYILRHKPEAARITLDKEGWTSIDDLLAKTNINRELLLKIVRDDAKGRYSISPDGTMIRANQGHSTSSVRMTFNRVVPPIVLYHGADDHHLDAIRKSGLLPMKRHHVHLSKDIETAEQVGGRRKHGYTVLEIDTKRMLADGHLFFISENGVYLAEHVPPKYIKELK